MRKVLVLLDRDSYERLAELAQRDEREVYQQASYLLKRTLSGTPLDPASNSQHVAIEEAAHAGVS